jgi:hypothetical protein
VTYRSLFDERPHRAEIEAHFLKAAAALLPACKKAAAAFEKCGFISARSFKTKQPRGHKNKPLYQQKSSAFFGKAARLCHSFFCCC